MRLIELHLHLEGAAPPDFIRELAARKGVSLDGIFADDGGYKWQDFNDFLRVYEGVTSVLTTPGDYAALLDHVLDQAASHGAIYAELFVAPEFCGGGDLGAWRDYVAALTEAADAARARGIDSRGIATIIRHFGPERARATAICGAETAGGWITGLGMGGDEMIGRATDFAWSYDCAAEAGLGLTCHAGEWGGPSSIREALALGCTRIGHGIQAANDPALLGELAEKGTVLEVCPASNVALGAVPSWQDHPINRLRDAGVGVTVSTDDPPFFRTDLSCEYQMLERHHGWGAPDVQRANITAAKAAFVDDTTRQALLDQLTEDRNAS